MARKIAPELRALHVGGASIFDGDRAERELRALLAVATAARAHHIADVVWSGRDEPKGCTLCRALSRLDRVSKGGK